MTDGIEGQTLQKHVQRAMPQRGVMPKTNYSSLHKLTDIREQRRRDERAYQEDEKRRREDYLANVSKAGVMPSKYQRAYDESYANLFQNASDMSTQELIQSIGETNRIAGIGETIQGKRMELYAKESDGTGFITEQFEDTFEDNGQPFNLNEQALIDVQSMKNTSGYRPDEQKIADSLNASLGKMIDNNPELAVTIKNGLYEARTTGRVDNADTREAIATAIHLGKAEPYLREQMARKRYDGDVVDFALNRWGDILDTEKVDIKTYKVPQPKADRVNSGAKSEDIELARDVKRVVNNFQDNKDPNEINEYLSAYGFIVSPNKDGESFIIQNSKGDDVTGNMTYDNAKAIYNFLDKRAKLVSRDALDQVEFADPTPSNPDQDRAESETQAKKLSKVKSDIETIFKAYENDNEAAAKNLAKKFGDDVVYSTDEIKIGDKTYNLQNETSSNKAYMELQKRGMSKTDGDTNTASSKWSSRKRK